MFSGGIPSVSSNIHSVRKEASKHVDYVLTVDVEALSWHLGGLEHLEPTSRINH